MKCDGCNKDKLVKYRLETFGERGGNLSFLYRAMFEELVIGEFDNSL